VKAAAEIYLETAACSDSSGWRFSSLMWKQKAANLSDIIINEKLKVLQANYVSISV